MKLSIVIPVYNTEKYLKECLDSIISAIKNDDVELIIIDDGSTDSSNLIYNNYSFKNLKKIKIENSGVSNARNIGINAASGDWIMFVDSDDTLSENWYKTLSKYFSSEYDVIYFFEKIDKSLNISKDMIFDSLFGVSNLSPYFGSPCSRIIKTDILKKNNIKFIEGIINGEDLLFNVEILSKIKNFEVIQESFYNYRVNEVSATNTFNTKIFNSDKQFHVELRKMLNKYKIKKGDLYSTICIRNAIKLLLYRMSLVKNINVVKKYKNCFYDEPYYSFIKNNTSDIVSYASKFPILAIRLYKLKRVFEKKVSNDKFIKI